MAIKQLCDEDCSALKQIQRGDHKAIALLYYRYSSIVYSVALRVLRDPALSKQVLLDVFMEIWRSPSRFMKITGSLSFSLIMMARNRAIAVLHRTPASDLDLAVPDWVGKHPAMNMTREEVCAEIDKMPWSGG